MNPITPPRAHSKLLVEGVIRRCPSDFFVDEMPACRPSGEGEHLLLRIEKSGRNTRDVAEDLARAFSVMSNDVSFAGLKDRHAVTRQWFSVRTPRDSANLESPSWRVLESARHVRKLRRGDLAGNAFRIRVRDLTGEVGMLAERLDLLRSHGAPNYFGEQRFGHDGANVERARRWLCRRPRAAVSAFDKGLHLSTARALLFNAVLATRVAKVSWCDLIDGDVAVDDLPTGPLWGRGRPAARGAALAVETEALEGYRDWIDPLEHVGLVQERRTLVLRPANMTWSIGSGRLDVAFELAPGQFATSLLRELGAFCQPARVTA